jgi:hypothetical protein
MKSVTYERLGGSETMKRYTVKFWVASPTMSGHAEYEVVATDEESAISVAKRRAARDYIPTLSAEVTVECLGEYYS